MKTKAEMPSLPEERGDGGVRSVQVALDVLEAVAFSDEELGVTQIAERLGLTKGSVHRHLLTLVERGYTLQERGHDPLLARSAQSLVAHYAPGTDLIQLAVGPMRELRDLLGHSVVLSEFRAARRAGAEHGGRYRRNRDRRAAGQRTAVSFFRTRQGVWRSRHARSESAYWQSPCPPLPHIR